VPSTPDPEDEADRDSGTDREGVTDRDGGADLGRVADIERGTDLDPGVGVELGTGAPAEALEGVADLGDLAETAGTAARRFTGAVAGATFVVLHGVVLWLVLSLGLVAPGWAVGVLSALWLAVAVAGWRGRARHPLITMLLPVVTAGLVLGAVALGGQVLGWSA
jgi:hypothetical protein